MVPQPHCRQARVDLDHFPLPVTVLSSLSPVWGQIGVGILRYTPPKVVAGNSNKQEDDADEGLYDILSNPRKTYITPPGTGFLPRETAWHHQQVRSGTASPKKKEKIRD